MAEFMLILPAGQGPTWPPLPSSDDPQTILLRLVACLRDLDRVDAGLAGAYLETAIQHLRVQFDLDQDPSETE